MQGTGIIEDISIDYKTHKPKITIVLNEREYLNSIENLKKDKLSIEIKKHRNKRSLDANSYCWVLCDKIAKELCKDGTVTTKEDVYKNEILQIGTFEPFIVQERTFENFKRIWEKQGLGFLVQEVSRKNKCIKVNCYYGSSTYDAKEMSLLIQSIVELAKTLEIETKPKAEIESMLKEWDK